MTTGNLMRVEISNRPPVDQLPSEDDLPAMQAHHFDPMTGRDDAAEAGLALLEPLTRQGAENSPFGKVGRNEPCPCGSGKKFKHCHGALV
jgi:preprotein translocase subunit SecA